MLRFEDPQPGIIRFFSSVAQAFHQEKEGPCRPYSDIVKLETSRRLVSICSGVWGVDGVGS